MESDNLKIYNKLIEIKLPKITKYKCVKCGRVGSKLTIKSVKSYSVKVRKFTRKHVCRYGCLIEKI